MTLVACSTKPEPTITNNPVICPIVTECQPVPITKLKTNSDLVKAYVSQTERISLCILAINSLIQCINDYNKNIGVKPNK